jgi:hypothetical protein
MQFFWFFISWTSDSQKIGEAFGSGFFWSNHACCGQITTQLRTPRGRYDEHSSKFSLSKKPRFIEPVGKSQTSEGDAC